MAPSVSRRGVIQAGLALPWALRSVAESRSHRPGPPRWVFLGTDKGRGVYRAAWNPVTGELGEPKLALELWRPAFFAAHPTLPILYTADEGAGRQATVSALGVDVESGALKLLGSTSSRGDGPCYVSVNGDGSLLLAANYAGGSVAAIPLDVDGVPGIPGRGVDRVRAVSPHQPQTELLQKAPVPNSFNCNETSFCGPLGPVKDRQDAPHLHCAVFAPRDSYALVCDLGDDAILVFGPRLSETYTLGRPARIAARPGSGPRHVAFHPNGKWVYCIHELDCSVDLYDWRANGKTFSLALREGSTVSTLAPGAALTGNTACEVVVGDDGRFVYTCTRGAGSNSITVYAVDPGTGNLREQQTLSCGGAVPRWIGFDPSRRWLLCTNQGSSSVTVFAHDAATGRLGEKPRTFAADTPMCVAFA